MRINYFEPSEIEIDPIVFKLSGGDISKAIAIENYDFELCYNWFYLLKVRELNEMKVRIAELKKIKDS